MTRMPPTIEEHVALPGRGMGGAAASEGGGLTPGDFVRILRQRMFLAMFIWIFVTGLSVLGTYLWIRYWPGYEAIGAVQVISTNPRPLLDQAAHPLHGDLMERALEDQVLLLRDLTILDQTLQDADVRTTEWFRSYEGDTQQAFLDFQEDLVCVPIRGSSYVRVSFMCKERDDPHRIVNTLLRNYETAALARAELPYREEKGALEDDLSSLRTQINEKKLAIRAFMEREMPAGGAEQVENPITARLRILAQQLAMAQQQRDEFGQIRQLYEDPRSQTLPLHVQQEIERDPRVASAYGAVQQLNFQIQASQANGFGENHRIVREFTAQRDLMEQLLYDQRAELTQQFLAYQRYVTGVQYQMAQGLVLDLGDEYAKVEGQQRDLDVKRNDYTILQEDLTRLNETYTQRLEDQRNLNLAIDAKHTFRVARVPASEPKERAMPRWEINVPVGAVFGLLLGVGIVVLLEFIDTSVRSGRDIVRHVQIPILGTVPDLDDEEVAIDDIMSAVTVAPNSMVAEAFRSIRTNLQLSAPADRQRTLLITSPQPEDGKTAVAVNLAESLAHNHRRVLLIDANFRRPALNRVYGQTANEGLSDILIGQGTLESLVRPTKVPRLDVLVSGRVPPNPAELLGSPEMQALIDEAAKRYDQVIFDVPPVLLVTDALVLASAVNAVIVVCRAKETTRGIAQRTRDQLADVNARIIGGVLNAAQVRRGGYFREQYRAFYDYQTEPLPAIEPPPDPKKLKNEDSRPT